MTILYIITGVILTLFLAFMALIELFLLIGMWSPYDGYGPKRTVQDKKGKKTP
jgi:hypothetical protein